jgi:hypothetical protein
MLEGDEWKQEDKGVVPTPTNINYWFRQQDTLLVEYKTGYRHETTIQRVVNNGEYFAVSTVGFMMPSNLTWLKHDEINVLAVTPRVSSQKQTIDSDGQWFIFNEQTEK